MDISILKKLGLSDKEIKVFLVLLEQGASSVRGLAEISGLNRGTTYDILKNLQEQGLVSFFHKEAKQNFVAEDPEKLIKLSQEKEKQAQEVTEKLREFIPELKTLQEKGGEGPVAKLYEGKKGIKFILEDILSSFLDSEEKVYYVYSVEGVREDVYSAFPDYNKKRIKNKIVVKTISLSEGGGTYGLDERKWFKVEKKASMEMTYILIYGNKCAFIARDSRGAPVGVIIENKMIYETQRIIFLQLWSLL
jgi:sugar-specific transcriptional regulator TrmB